MPAKLTRQLASIIYIDYLKSEESISREDKLHFCSLLVETFKEVSKDHTHVYNFFSLQFFIRGLINLLSKTKNKLLTNTISVYVFI